MQTSLERILEERQIWRAQRQRRSTKIKERSEVGWRYLCEALHRTIVRHNSLGKPTLGIRRTSSMLEVHRLGQLCALLTVSLDDDSLQMQYRSPLHEGSVILDREGAIMAPYYGVILLMDSDGRIVKFGYGAAAEYLLAPVIEGF